MGFLFLFVLHYDIIIIVLLLNVGYIWDLIVLHFQVIWGVENETLGGFQ